MNISKEEQQRKEFREILFELSASLEILKSAPERSQIYRRLEKLYYSEKEEDRFRHFYSDIFSVVSQIQQGDKPGSLDILGQNLLEIRQGYRALNVDKAGVRIDISDSIRKLYDHISLDIARMGYSDAADRRISQEEAIRNLKNSVNVIQKDEDKISKDIASAKSQIEHFEERMKDTQKDYIAILGIFAAIVITFTSGITFATSVLNNIHKASIFRLIGITALIGLVLINMLYGLFYYIDRITRIDKKRRDVPVIIANVILSAIIVIVGIMWYSHHT